ncbi:anti-phage ZorAB system protein ZorA [Hydrogenophaga sp. OTU3427]|uniref:anti-phage ZorAB system protein ZorA n=1 Tax=Hydrogenophaga sp. OTU3427 TaxID=3043856 RepID=UPI00313D6B98
MTWMEMVLNAPQALLLLGGVLAVLLLAFLALFFFPGLFLRFRLANVLKQLKQGEPRTEGAMREVFEPDPRLKHLWKEFSDTLHKQKEERDGQLVTVAFRATAPAESFFNSQQVVDSRLRTEFFKHLPGIFTGIGIIGTFSGLIVGLKGFEVSQDPALVSAALKTLLDGVTEAFLVSALAIGLAMLVTLVEKWFLASLYRLTEDIAQHLDGMFSMGAGEEYLSRLVTASEDSAAQSKILKDALVGDLKVMLQEMTERQIAAGASQSEALGRQITGGIESSLQAPLQRIGEIVEKASGEQTSTAAHLLQDVMASFSQRLNELFGGQISGIQELNQRSAQAMQDAVASLNTLVGRMEQSTERSGEAMADRMAKAIEEMERRQADINNQTQALVSGIQDLVARSQSETSAKLNEAIAGLSKQVSEMIGALQAQSARSNEEQRQREQTFNEHTTGMVSSMGASVAEVVKKMAESTVQMQQSVASLERTTTTSIDKMNAGARVLEQGATAFAQAGERVTGALTQAATVASKMTEVSGSLTSSSSALQTVMADYKANREATASMLSELKSVVESAKREASMTQQALERIQSAASKLSEAQAQAEVYLDGVSEVLGAAHERFADGLTKTLDRANGDFHAKLSSAVGLLASAVEELEVSLAGAATSRR